METCEEEMQRLIINVEISVAMIADFDLTKLIHQITKEKHTDHSALSRYHFIDLLWRFTIEYLKVSGNHHEQDVKKKLEKQTCLTLNFRQF